MSQVIYKSKYALVCELVGHPKLPTQEEENYCQITEQETSTAQVVLSKMLVEYIEKINGLPIRSVIKKYRL